MREALTLGPPIRLVGMVWVPIFIIFTLPVGWIALKIILGLFALVVVRGSFQPIWEEYKTMGAFVTLETVYFIVLLWMPDSIYWARVIPIGLILLGWATKKKQIDHINKGLGPDLRKKDSS